MSKHDNSVRRDYVQNQRRSLVVFNPILRVFLRYEPGGLLTEFPKAEGVRHHYEDEWPAFFRFQKDSIVVKEHSSWTRFTNDYPHYDEEKVA